MPRWTGLACNGKQGEAHLHCIDSRKIERAVVHDPPGLYLSPQEFSRSVVRVLGKDAIGLGG
jgi:hypothetical protein